MLAKQDCSNSSGGFFEDDAFEDDAFEDGDVA